MAYTSLPTVTTDQPIKASWGNLVDSNLDDHQSRIAALEGASASSLDGLTDVAIASPLADQVLAYSGSSWVNTAPILRRAVVSLTDAQVKALPTTPINLIGAPGAGFYIALHAVEIQTKFASGAYTNLNATYAAIGLALVGTGASGAAPSMLVADDAAQTPAMTLLTKLLSASSRRLRLLPYMESNPAYVNPGSADGSYAIDLIADVENKTLTISADNNGSGAFTGGNAANAMKVIVYFTVEPVP